MKPLAAGSVGVVLGLLIGAGGCAWLRYAPSSKSIPAPPARELAGVATTTLKCADVVVYHDAVKKRLGLPQDPTKHVVAATQVAPSDHPHTATAVYDEGTGGTGLYLRRDRLPWLAFNHQAEVGLAYGVRDSGGGARWRADARWALVQTKGLNWGPVGSADGSGGWFVGIGGWVRW